MRMHVTKESKRKREKEKIGRVQDRPERRNGGGGGGGRWEGMLEHVGYIGYADREGKGRTDEIIGSSQ